MSEDICDALRCEFRRTFVKSLRTHKNTKMVTWIGLSVALAMCLYMFRHYECDVVLFESSRVSLRRQLFTSSVPDEVSDVVKGTVVDFDVFERSKTFYSFRTVRLNNSKGYPVTCTIPVLSGTDEKHVLEMASFDTPFETDVVFSDEMSGMCTEVVPIEKQEHEHPHRRLDDADVQFCSTLQRVAMILIGGLVGCWLVLVVWDDRLKKYGLSDFMRDRKDFTDLLNSYDASKDVQNLKKAVDEVRESVLGNDADV